jgi:hypothetical protein
LSFSDSKDNSKILALCIALQRKSQATEASPATVDIVLINDYSTRGLEGRTSTPGAGISNIFVGRNPASAKDFENLKYVGDREIKTEKTTLHLRLIYEKETIDDSGNFIPVPWIAVHPAEDISISMLEEIA